MVLLREAVCPMVIKVFSPRATFPIMTRLLRVVVAVVRGFLTRVPSEAEILLTMFTRLFDDNLPPWVNAEALEVVADLAAHPTVCADLATLYDLGPNETHLFDDIAAAASRLVERNAQLVSQVSPAIGRSRWYVS